jgi:hypothetical protein
MVSISSDGILRFNVVATKTIKQINAQKLWLFWNPDEATIGIVVAFPCETQAYTITYNKKKTVCQIVASSLWQKSKNAKNRPATR